jgi:iron complex transport system permease protein
MARRLDLMGLGDDTAAVLGVPVRRTRAAGTLIAVLLTATAVTLAGPIGFVGLFAPVITRLLARGAPWLRRHAVMLPAAGLLGAVSVVLTDAVVRAAFGSEQALSIPTGVTTTIFGSIVLIVVARSTRDAGPTREPPGARVAVRTRRRFVMVVAIGSVAVVALAVVGLLAGQRWPAPSDLAAWWRGEAAPLVQFAVRERGPRIGAALVAGAALALAGAFVQATCRNPLAEPGLLGITAGAGLGAVVVVTNGTLAMSTILAAAMVGALVAFIAVYALAWRGGLHADRLVLIGVGVWYGTSAVSTLLLVRANPWDTPRIFTWLSGTTYGRTWSQVIPVAIALAVGLAFALGARRELDLLAVDDDTPRLTGVGLEQVRLAALAMAAVLAATAVVAVGVVGFVGLIAAHAARALVGGRQLRVAPVAALLGAVLLGTADTLGRTVIAPQQLPAGLTVALVGAPYFVYLLARSRC